jgi:hypothetical protein
VEPLLIVAGALIDVVAAAALAGFAAVVVSC